MDGSLRLCLRKNLSMKIKQVYHHINKWECVQAGFWNTTCHLDKERAEKEYSKFLSDLDLFDKSIKRVFKEWSHSCEQFLTNEAINRIAWIGQSAMCIETGVPSVFRGGFKLLSEDQKILANTIALKNLSMWSLRNMGISMRNKIIEYVESWEKKGYVNDIPDEVPDEIMRKNFAPSYKAIALAVLNNDHSLKSLGFTPNKSKFYNILKRMELEERGAIQKKSNSQIKFNFMKG